MAVVADTAEPASRALSPVESGYADAAVSASRYEVFGEGEQTLLLLPPWAIIHSRFWKAQVPYLARHFRVITFDGRGNGRSDRPDTPPTTAAARRAADALAVLDAVGADDCVLVVALRRPRAAGAAAGRRPSRADHGRGLHVARAAAHPAAARAHRLPFDEELPTYEGWAQGEPPLLGAGLSAATSSSSSARCYPEPHSTKQIEDAVGWALETDAGDARRTRSRRRISTSGDPRAARPARAARCSSRRATRTGSSPPTAGRRSPSSTGAELVELEAVGHCPHARAPGADQPAVRDFAERAYGRPAPRGRRGAARSRRRKRALYRLLADRARPRLARRRDRARAARAQPELEIDWLAQDPVTRVLESVRRAHPSGQPAACQRVAPHRRRGARARAQRLPGLAPDGRDPARQLHALPRRRRARSRTTCGSATRPGSSTTTCTRTRS